MASRGGRAENHNDVVQENMPLTTNTERTWAFEDNVHDGVSETLLYIAPLAPLLLREAQQRSLKGTSVRMLAYFWARPVTMMTHRAVAIGVSLLIIHSIMQSIATQLQTTQYRRLIMCLYHQESYEQTGDFWTSDELFLSAYDIA